MSQLPTGWLTASLGDLQVEARSGFPSGRHNSEARGVPHLRPMNISRFGNVDLDAVKYVESPRDQRVRQGDVLFNNTNSPALVGKTAYFGYQGDWAYSNHMTRLRPPAGLDARFLAIQLHYLWRCGAFLRLCSNHVNQASVSSKTLLQAVRIVLPPTAEQERIVVAIEEQLSRLDAAVVALVRTRRNITRIRGAVQKAAVTGMLSVGDAASVQEGGVDDDPLADHLNATNTRKVRRAADDLLPLTWEIPPSWDWKSASDVCEVVASGSTPAKAAMTAGCGDVPFIKVYNLTHSGDLDFSVRPTFIDRATHEGSLRRSRLYPGDVLTNIVGPPLGKVSVVPNEYPEWNTNQAVVVFRPVQSIHPRLLRYWLLSPPVLKLLESTSRATAGQFNVSLTTCRALPLPIPPRAEQDALVAILEDCFSLLDVVEVAAEHALSRSSSLRASVLATAFSGKLVAQDPSDEPASVLFKRIAAERA
jgi:type I restriction enzyme S subunit